MDDYIKRSDAVHALCKAVHKDDGVIPCGNQTTSCLWSKTRVCDYAREIDALPSADVQPVVRCRDCKWFNKIGCAIKIVDESDKPHEDDFCSFAERRTDESD